VKHRAAIEDGVSVFARVAIGTAFLSAVADRFGWWGPPGARHVAWGDFSHFLAYADTITPFVPIGLVPAAGSLATILELILGVALIVGVAIRPAAVLSGVLLASFALGMTFGTGIKTAFDASVFSASAAAFLLACASRYPLALETIWRGRSS